MVCRTAPLSVMQIVLFVIENLSVKRVHSFKQILRGLRLKESYEPLNYIQGNLRQIIYCLSTLVF